MNKKNIFLLPLDLKGKKQTRITPKFIREVYNSEKKAILPEHIQKKKNNIFTVELNRLIGKISDKNKSSLPKDEDQEREKKSATASSKESAQTYDLPINPNNKFSLLNKIYANQNPEVYANEFLSILFNSLGIKNYCIFFYEPHTYTYYPLLSEGISEQTKTNLLFQSNDKFLQNKSEGYVQLHFQPLLINDIFFKKKLSPKELSFYGSAFVKFLNTHNLMGLISILFEKDKHPNAEEIEKLSADIDLGLEPLVPFLNSHFQSAQKANIDSYDILRKNINAIRIQSQRLGINTFYFSKLIIKNYTKVENPIEKKKNLTILLKNYLLPNEGLIEINHNIIALLTQNNEIKKIIKYISENTKTDFEFQIDVLKYPDYGKNLYLYL
ncbi:MAG: hypothetical protein IPL26_02560 [Leptospiraceae bacterium]|nr:hypothetical protein [Leptospiraceae bacterium]